MKNNTKIASGINSGHISAGGGGGGVFGFGAGGT
jgi:hypothetical protein